MKKICTITLLLYALLALAVWIGVPKTALAAGGADYGRGAETDPVAYPLATQAQATANTAVSNAATALAAGTNAQNTANTAVSNAASALASGTNAQTTANTAVSNAATALATAQAAGSNSLVSGSASNLVNAITLTNIFDGVTNAFKALGP